MALYSTWFETTTITKNIAPYRLIVFRFTFSIQLNRESEQSSSFGSISPDDLNISQKLGIIESDSLTDDQSYPIAYGGSKIKNILAVCQMIALHQNAPFRKDVVQKLIEGQFKRNKGLSLELIGRLCETLGLKSQLATVDSKNILSLDCPVVIINDDCPQIIYGFYNEMAIIANPQSGLQRINIEDLKSQLGERFRFVLSRRTNATPQSRFGWHWFTPLLNKYRRSLILVFVASLLAQLFGIAIPLLIQQIIDKVLSQGNLSSLNVIGSVMIILALFQGMLMALRTYIFVDTTDRMFI